MRIDDPIAIYFSGIPIQNKWETTNPITIRHLLDHTSGLSDLRLWHFFSSSSNPLTPLSEFYSKNNRVLKVHTKPGDLFSYSNMGYTLLGMIIEQVTNQRYETYLDVNLLQPIGMYHSTFQFISQEGINRSDMLAMGHFDNGTIAPSLSIYLRPAAQFTTTASDMGRLITFILNKGKVGSLQLIQSDYFDNLGKPDYTTAARKGLGGGYALGISFRDRHGVTGYAHSGNIVGYRAMIYIFPDQKKGFFIAHNMDSETANYEAFNKELIESLEIPKVNFNRYESQSTKGWESMEGYYIPVVTKIEPLTLLDIIGSFSKVEITAKGMNIIPFQKKGIELMHLGKGVFIAQDRVLPSHVLYQDNDTSYLTTGIYTSYKINGLKILGVFISMILSILGLIGVLIIGSKKLVKNFKGNIRHPIMYSYIAIFGLLISAILIATKNIIYIGDINTGSIAMYTSSLLFPILVFFSIVAFIKSKSFKLKSPDVWFVLFLAQFSFVLLYYDLIPFTTWK